MKVKSHKKAVKILLAEDNPGDVRLIQEILKKSRVPNRLDVVVDGVQLMSYLRREGKFTKAVMPDLILLDLNMPRKDGREALADIKADEALKHIPVVILTSSDQEQDILKMYNLHASSYIKKPMDLHEFGKVIKFIVEFWLKISKLPNDQSVKMGR